jgi:hypothetical protein
MQNPIQKNYTTEELFLLRPEPVLQQAKEAPPIQGQKASSAASNANTLSNAIQDSPRKNIGFWKKNKWYLIIGGIAAAGYIVWYVRKRQQKKTIKK